MGGGGGGGQNCDLYVKQTSPLFVHELTTFPKDWKTVNIKLKSPKNKQKCIIVFGKTRKGKAKEEKGKQFLNSKLIKLGK